MRSSRCYKIVSLGDTAVAYARQIYDTSEFGNELDTTKLFHHAWTCLPADMAEMELCGIGSGIFEGMPRKVEQIEVDTSARVLFRWAIRIAKRLKRPQMIFDDPFHRGKAFELDDETILRPVSADRQYVLERKQLRLYNVSTVFDHCAHIWAGGAVVCDTFNSVDSNARQKDPIQCFLCTAFDDELTMIVGDSPLLDLVPSPVRTPPVSAVYAPRRGHANASESIS